MIKMESVQIMLGGRERLRMYVVAGTLSVVTLLLAAARFVHDDAFSIIVLLQIASAVVFFISAILFHNRFEKSASHLLVTGGLLGLFAMAFFGSGITSEAMFWLPFVPLLAAFLTSYKSAVVYTLVTLGGLLVMSRIMISSPLHVITLASVVTFSCALGVFLERSRTLYESKLADMATSHAITGLPSRVVFDVLLNRTTSQNIPYALVFIDVEGLKSVNEVYGHAAGDAMLLEIGLRLGTAIRGSETLFHISGDKFAIIADDTPALEDLKDRFRNASGEFVYMNFRIPLSIHVGATHGTEDSETSLAAADSDMHLDRAGRGYESHGRPTVQQQH